MTPAEVRTIVQGFGRSAVNFQLAGYDGIEIHAAHGYLVAQFLSAASNRRLDAYRGDTLDGRMRLLVEIVEEVRESCGVDYPVGVRLSADEHTRDGLTLDDTVEIIDALQEAAPVDYVSITTGMRGLYVKDSSWDEGFALPLAEAVKQGVDIPVIAAGRIRHPDLAERALEAGQADFIGIGRGLLADPEWVAKARAGDAGRIRPCIGIVQDCRRYAGGVACAVNPRLGRESTWHRLPAPPEPRRVVVAGGGPAGLEAARLAATSGHQTVLFEADSAVGGQLRIAGAGPTREELLDFVFYLERELDRLEVDVRRGSRATAESVLGESPDLVVCATGATPQAPSFPVDGGARVVTVWDLLGGSVTDIPARAVVLDDGSGFWHGVSAAEYLAERGAVVELVTPARGIALAIPEESTATVLQRLRGNGVRFRTLTTVTGVSGSERCPGRRRERRGGRHVRRARRRANAPEGRRRSRARARHSRSGVRHRRQRGTASPDARCARREPRDPAARFGDAARDGDRPRRPVNIVALVKYVPNPSGIPPEIGPDFRLRRDGPEGSLDPTDEPGVELATQLTRANSGTTTAMTMGPEQSVKALWRALALGADRGVAVVDDALRGADALATANVLAAAIRRHDVDLVIAGVESTDGATGTLPAALAELLGVPSLTFARALEVAGGTVRIERQTGGGYDVLECSLPALVTVTGAAAQPRHPSVRETIAAKKKPIETLVSMTSRSPTRTSTRGTPCSRSTSRPKGSQAS